MTKQEQLKQLESELAVIKRDYDQKADPIKEQIRKLTQQIIEDEAGFKVGDKVKWKVDVRERAYSNYGSTYMKKVGEKEAFGIVARITDMNWVYVFPYLKDGSLSNHEKWIHGEVTKVT